MASSSDPLDLLSPAMRELLGRLARASRVPMHLVPPEMARAWYEASAGVLEHHPPAMARDEVVRIPNRHGHVMLCRLWVPHSAPAGKLPVLLFFHGGGFVIGSPNTHAGVCQQLAQHAGCAVLSVDYRLAPEDPFPSAHDDAWDALQWLLQHGTSLGLDCTRVAIGGDSAGGTLSAATAIAARDAHIPLRLQMLFYPGCAPHQDMASHTRFGQNFVLEAAVIDYFYGHLLRSEADRLDWRFAPLLAPDLNGVAPVWMGLAECDPLVDEGLAYAERLRMAGVPVTLEMYRGMVHGFIQMDRALPEAAQAHQDAAHALRAAFH